MKNPVTLKQAIKGKSRVHAAFSLIELLVVIAVIGIIAAIAIPNIGNLTAGAGVAKNQRNAQNLASVFSAARAAGNTSTFATKELAVAALVTSPGLAGLGTSPATFRVPNLAAGDQTTALVYLQLSATDGTGQLLYDAAATP
jgi:type IV pilus assembly protein PilA